MEVIKRDVDELNELAEKMTGTNPKANTTSEVLNYIEQNYSGGSGNSNIVVLEFDLENNSINLTPSQFDFSKIYAVVVNFKSGNDTRYSLMYAKSAVIGTSNSSIIFKGPEEDTSFVASSMDSNFVMSSN